MIHFFRRIRHKFLDEGSISKYLFYAIGEIALVMIGILLALQVNNWNEKRKAAQLEKQYLLALKEEFILNTEKLKTLDTFLDNQLAATSEFIQNIHPEKVMLDNVRFAFLIGEGFRDTYNYNPSSGVMNDLINSGKLSLISNAKLRRILADWESNISHIKEFEDEAKKASFNVVEILRTRGNFRNQMKHVFKALGTGPSHFKKSNTELLNSELLESSVVYFAAVTWRLKHVKYPGLSEKMEVVLSIIEEELNKKQL